MNYSYFSVSETGKKRKTNEDSVGIFRTEFGLLIIVCDGLGGGISGEFASKNSLEKIYDTFINSNENDFLKRIQTSIIQANSFVHKKSNSNLNFKGMAATCEVLLLNDSSFYWGHLGDSRIYILKNNKLKKLTKDHSIIQELIDQGRVKEKDVKNDKRKNIVAKAIGDVKIPDIDISKRVLSSNDFFKFFLCTDGVTCVVTEDELEQFLLNDDLKEISLILKDIIERRGSPDNYSFVIVSN